MLQKNGLLHKLTAIFLAPVLLVPILTACDDDGELIKAATTASDIGNP